jgi:hypothetical protein
LSERSRKEDKSDEIKEHDLAKRIAKDTNLPGGVTVLCGYVGKSGSEDTVRLYTSIEFNEYYEIKKDDVSASKEVSEDVLPFGGTCIFVKSDAEVNHVIIESTKEQAKFLGGIVSEDLVRPAISAGMGVTRRRRLAAIPRTLNPKAIGPCGPLTVDTCATDCRTACATNCGAVCGATQNNTCRTCATNCGTCATHCGTCATDCHTKCVTDCGARCGATQNTCPTDCHTACVTDCNCTFDDPCGSVREICPQPFWCAKLYTNVEKRMYNDGLLQSWLWAKDTKAIMTEITEKWFRCISQQYDFRYLRKMVKKHLHTLSITLEIQ